MMIPFGGKRKRQNDELAMIVEPITYSDAVKKYGIEFKQITIRDRVRRCTNLNKYLFILIIRPDLKEQFK